MNQINTNILNGALRINEHAIQESIRMDISNAAKNNLYINMHRYQALGDAVNNNYAALIQNNIRRTKFLLHSETDELYQPLDIQKENDVRLYELYNNCIRIIDMFRKLYGESSQLYGNYMFGFFKLNVNINSMVLSTEYLKEIESSIIQYNKFKASIKTSIPKLYFMVSANYPSRTTGNISPDIKFNIIAFANKNDLNTAYCKFVSNNGVMLGNVFSSEILISVRKLDVDKLYMMVNDIALSQNNAFEKMVNIIEQFNIE